MKTALFFYLIMAFSPLAVHADFCSSSWGSNPQVAKLAKHSEWLRLLHFRRNRFYFSSQADGRDFFVSENGHLDPQAELIATIKGSCDGQPREVNQKKIKSIPVACQFPARLRWIKKQWPAVEIAAVQCPELTEWRVRTRAQTIKLVFSSYYANNPSSVFGHTLVRLDPMPNREGGSSALLSSGVNFAAEVGPVNPVIYALYGMAGLFPGKFTSIPYYYKVREYNDFDSRDLWEYELALTPDELEQFVDHLWELGFTHFNYYYFTENCSYQLLTALEGAVPRIDASDRIPWWVIPADSVKAIVRTPGLLGSVDFRPSLFRQYAVRKSGLTKTEVKGLTAIIGKRDLSSLKNYPEARQAALLDTALDFWDYKYARELVNNDADKVNFKQVLLGLRAQRPKAEPLTIERPSRPDLSHESMRYGLYYQAPSAETNLLGMEFRFSLHDWLDPQEGYPETAKIEFYKFQVDFGEAKAGRWSFAPKVRQIQFFEVFLLSPFSEDNFNFSWRAVVGVDRRWGLGCNDCLAGLTSFQGGLTGGFLNNRWLLFALAGGQLRLSSEIESHGVIAVPTWTLGTRLKLTHRWLAWAEFNREYLLGLDNREGWVARAETRYSPTLSHSVGVGWLGDGWKDENKLLLQFYYFH